MPSVKAVFTMLDTFNMVVLFLPNVSLLHHSNLKRSVLSLKYIWRSAAVWVLQWTNPNLTLTPQHSQPVKEPCLSIVCLNNLLKRSLLMVLSSLCTYMWCCPWLLRRTGTWQALPRLFPVLFLYLSPHSLTRVLLPLEMPGFPLRRLRLQNPMAPPPHHPPGRWIWKSGKTGFPRFPFRYLQHLRSKKVHVCNPVQKYTVHIVYHIASCLWRSVCVCVTVL